MTLALATVADAIAGLAVASLTMKDINEIPAEVGNRAPMLIPAANFMSDFVMERDSFGGGSVAKMTVTYTLNYVLCYKAAAAGRSGILEYYDEMIAMTTAILDKVLAVDTMAGTIDIVPISVSGMGVVQDPAGMDYIGCYLAFRVQEFVN